MTRSVHARPAPGLFALLTNGSAALLLVGALGIALLFGLECVRYVAGHGMLAFLLGAPSTHAETDPLAVAPLLVGTLLVAMIALVAAVPLSLGTAICISEYVPTALKSPLRFILSVFASVPTVIFGFAALHVVTPHLVQPLFPAAGPMNALGAGITLAFMLLPTLSRRFDEALRAVPREVRRAATGLAASKADTLLYLVLPAAAPAMRAAMLLAASRAIGETMVVTLAAGAVAHFTFNPTDEVKTLTTAILEASQIERTGRGGAVFALGFVSLAIATGVNLIAHGQLRSADRWMEQKR